VEERLELYRLTGKLVRESRDLRKKCHDEASDSSINTQVRRLGSLVDELREMRLPHCYKRGEEEI